MSSSTQLDIQETDGLLRIVIPLGKREKFWMVVTYSSMLIFGSMMALLAELAIRSVSSNRLLWSIPFLIFGIVILFFVLSLLTISSMPDAVVEYDGKSLSIGSVGSDRRSTWPRKQIKSISVSRLPMVPIANLVILAENNPAVRLGVSGRPMMEAVATRLRDAMELTATKSKKGKRK